MSGISFFLIPKLLEQLFTWPGNILASNPDIDGLARRVLEFPDPTWAQGVAFILFGFGAFTYAKHPEGVIEFQTTAAVNRIVRRVERRRAAPGEPPTDTPDEESRDLART